MGRDEVGWGKRATETKLHCAALNHTILHCTAPGMPGSAAPYASPRELTAYTDLSATTARHTALHTCGRSS